MNQQMFIQIILLSAMFMKLRIDSTEPYLYIIHNKSFRTINTFYNKVSYINKIFEKHNLFIEKYTTPAFQHELCVSIL